jgi:hypothetical protein
MMMTIRMTASHAQHGLNESTPQPGIEPGSSA